VGSVEHVLCSCYGAEVCFSIIPSVAVYMVNVQMFGRIDNLPVHLDIESLFGFWASGVSAGIKGAYALDGIPFVFV